MKAIRVAVAAVLMAAGPAAAGDCVRCGTELVCVGDDANRLVAACGEPTRRERRGRDAGRVGPWQADEREVRELLAWRRPCEIDLFVRVRDGRIEEVRTWSGIGW